MKTKLLKKLRKKGRSQVFVSSITRTNGIITGMSIQYEDEKYGDLLDTCNTEEDIKNEAARIYIADYIQIHKRK